MCKLVSLHNKIICVGSSDQDLLTLRLWSKLVESVSTVQYYRTVYC